MIDDTVQGIHAIGLGTQGFRHMYGRKEVHKVEDLKGYKVRVQATATEDTMFAAYGAQTVHMPFGSVYTSLQTGVVDFGENAVNVYLINKHYEVAPVLSMTEHEANNAILWISDKLWQSLNADQKQWVLTAARDVSLQEPKRAFELERAAAAKLEENGRQDRRRCRQDGLSENRRSLSRQARQGTWTACRQDQDPDPGDQLRSAIEASCPGKSAKRVFALGVPGIHVFPQAVAPKRGWPGRARP